MNCIVILRSLHSLDNILPLLFELHKGGKIGQLTFIAKEKQCYDTIKLNYVLYDGIKYLGGTLAHLYPRRNKYLNMVHNIYRLRTLFYKRYFVIEHGLGSKLISAILGWNRNILGGKRVLSLIHNVPYRMAKNHQMCADIVKGRVHGY